MQFENLTELWQMAGHGPFVWASYAITAAVLAYMVWWPLQRKRSTLRRLAAQQRLEQHQTQREGSEI